MATKARSAGEGTIRRRADGSWEARMRTEGRRVSFYGATKQEAQRKLFSARQARQDGQRQPDKRTTVTQVTERWLAAKQPPAIEPTTFRGYVAYVKHHVIPAWGGIRAWQLTPGQVERYLNQMVRDGLSPLSARHVRAVLRAALGWAVKEGLLTVNVAEFADGPKVVRSPIEPLAP